MLNKNSKIAQFEDELGKQLVKEVSINPVMKTIKTVEEDRNGREQYLFHSNFISWSKLARDLNNNEYEEEYDD